MINRNKHKYCAPTNIVIIKENWQRENTFTYTHARNSTLKVEHLACDPLKLIDIFLDHSKQLIIDLKQKCAKKSNISIIEECMLEGNTKPLNTKAMEWYLQMNIVHKETIAIAKITATNASITALNHGQ